MIDRSCYLLSERCGLVAFCVARARLGHEQTLGTPLHLRRAQPHNTWMRFVTLNDAVVTHCAS